MNNNTERNMSIYGVLFTIIAILTFVPYIFHGIVYSNNDKYMTNVNKQEIHVFDTVDMESTLKLYNIKDAYDVNGTKYYIAKFREDITNKEIECHIPNSYEEKLNRDATYDCIVTITYLVNDYNRTAKETEKLIYENGKLTGEVNNDTMRRVANLGKSTEEYVGNAFGAVMVDIDFMYKNFMIEKFEEHDYVAEHKEAFKDTEVIIHEEAEEGSSDAN